MISTSISLCKINRKADRCIHWSSIHRTRSICNYNCVCTFFNIIGKRIPLSLKNLLFCWTQIRTAIIISITSTFILIKDVIRIKCSRINLLFSSYRFLSKLSKSLFIMSLKSISINHHCP